MLCEPLDYLETRPEININRWAPMGISARRIRNTFLAAAIDKHVKAAVVSGLLNTFRDTHP